MIKIVFAMFLALTALTGCATVTLPDGTRVSKEVYRAKAAQDLMTMAVAADREYDSRNPITPPPTINAVSAMRRSSVVRHGYGHL